MEKLNKLLDIVDSDMLMDMTREVNFWDGSLSQFNYISMEDFDEYMGHLSPTEIACEIQYGDFNINEEYFQFNAYDNLVSYTDWEVEEDLEDNKEDIVSRFIELYEDGHVETTYQEIYDILDEEVEVI